MIKFISNKHILNSILKQVPSFHFSFLKSKEEIKEIGVLSNDIQSMSKQMKQNEQRLMQLLDNDPTNQELKMKCAKATSLRRVLANEIQDYLKNKQHIEDIKYNLLKQLSEKGFLLLENSRKPVMSLVKKFESIQVEIIFRAHERHHVLKPDEHRHLYYNELDQTKDLLDIKFENQYFNSLHEERSKIAKDIILDQENPLGSPLEEYNFTFLVCIKNKPDLEEYMVYECEEAYGEISIQRVGLFQNYSEIEDILKFKEIKLLHKFMKLNMDSVYQPNFINLSERLQKVFLEHLECFDVDIQLVHNMHRASIFKQQNLFVEWLFHTHQIATDLE